jgi:hypothetical protein
LTNPGTALPAVLAEPADVHATEVVELDLLFLSLLLLFPGDHQPRQASGRCAQLAAGQQRGEYAGHVVKAIAVHDASVVE